jgi:hypothetical protein
VEEGEDIPLWKEPKERYHRLPTMMRAGSMALYPTASMDDQISPVYFQVPGRPVVDLARKIPIDVTRETEVSVEEA